jgi:hypothetical protein
MLRLIKQHSVFLFTTACWILLGFFSEHIIIYDGLGWDGSIHFIQVESFNAMWQTGRFDAYYFQRGFIDFLFVGANRLLGDNIIPVKAESLVLFYRIANVFLLIWATHFWLAILRFHGFVKPAYQFLAMCFLFVTYGSLKQFFYLPVNTDVLHLTSVLAIYYCFINQYLVGFIAAVMAGWLSHTSVPLVFAGSLVLQREWPVFLWLNFLKRFKLVIVLIANGLICALYFFWVNGNEHQLNHSLLALFSSMVYLTAILWYIFRIDTFPATAIKPPIWTTVLAIVAVLLTFIKLKLTVVSYYLDSSEFLFNLIDGAARNLFAQPIAHYFYFGNAFLLACIFAYKKKHFAHSTYFVGAVFYLLLSFSTESRQVFPLLVFITLFVLENIKEYNLLQKGFIWIVFILNFIISTVWFPLNPFKFHRCKTTDEFPAQWYFLHHGPWLQQHVAYLQLAIFILMLFIYYRFLKKQSSALQ